MQIVKVLTFGEMLPHHVAFVLMIIMEWDHLHKTRSPWRKKYAGSLKPGATLPHRETCIKIMRVLKGLMTAKLLRKLDEQKRELGDPMAGAQDDIWSMRNCKESFGALRISMIIKHQVTSDCMRSAVWEACDRPHTATATPRTRATVSKADPAQCHPSSSGAAR